MKPKEIAEIALALWYLPAEKVAGVGELVRTLRRDHGLAEPIDYSDDWTEEDLREWTRASASRVAEEYPEEEGYEDVPSRSCPGRILPGRTGRRAGRAGPQDR